MDVTDMLEAIEHEGTSQTILSQISEAPHWRQATTDFVNLIENCNVAVASFYEMELTKKLEMVGISIFDHGIISDHYSNPTDPLHALEMLTRHLNRRVLF